ncbi:MAG: hypothetical protein UIG59_04460 [Acutalibacteraceae bacterium]|nr:hypothetical protein [Acutalibacteraceae bacterium]
MEKFNNKTGFIMASVGSAVGLGNLFRFPYLALKYGGVFILAYFLLLLTTGAPLLMSELALGRLTGKSAVGALGEASKKGKFTGLLCSANSFFIMTYYCPLFSFVLVCAVFSFRLWGAQMPERVFTDIIYSENLAVPLLFLVFAWASVMLCLGDAGRLGKISTVGVLFSLFVLVCMAILSAVLQGGAVLSFLIPSASALLITEFWPDLLGQVFFSLSVMVGVMISYGAYLPKKENIFSSALTVCFADFAVSLCATVIYAAFSGKVEGGDILTCFSVYPAAFCAVGGGFGAVISFLFYLSLALLCQASVFSYLKAVCHSITEKIGISETKAALILTLVSCGLGIFLLGRSGISRLIFIDGGIVPLLILIAGLLETIVFSVKRKTLLCEINQHGKRGMSPGFYSFSVGFLSPAVIFLLIILKIFL